jgi:superoxide dismutase, Fe-Mn family
MPVEALVVQIDSLPEPLKLPVRNYGGGHANHSLFRTVMSPQGGGEPEGELARAIAADLGGFDAFKEAFTKAALTRFGSGSAWLCVDKQGRRVVENAGNQDSALMAD